MRRRKGHIAAVLIGIWALGAQAFSAEAAEAINTEEYTEAYEETMETEDAGAKSDIAEQATDGDDGSLRLFMTSEDFRDEMGIGINLGNTMEAYWASDERTDSGAQVIGRNNPFSYELCWGGKVVSQQMIDDMKAMGFGTIRIPVYWGNMMEEDGTFTISEDYLARVGQIIDFCRNDDLYAVINIHHYDEYVIKHFPKTEALEITSHLWEQIAEYYIDYSDYLIFEGFNENLGTTCPSETFTKDEIYEYVNEMNQTFVDAVRGTGENNEQRMLIASGYWTNIDNTSDPRFLMPEDTAEDRLMVSVHYVDNAMYWTNKIGGKEWMNYSIGQCEELKEAFTDKGIVVFVGECTANYDGRFASNAENKDSADCMQQMLELMQSYGFIPVYWETTGNYYPNFSDEVIKGPLAEMMNRVMKNNSMEK